jgi:uncharacterized MAPEG superfamily protein
MTVALWCILVAGLLPYVAVLTAKLGTRFDNSDPRSWLARQTGYRQRANAAHCNAFEALPLFAAGVIIAHYLHAPQAQIDTLALIFIGARILYFVMYLGNRPTLRSLCWMLGFGCVIGLFAIAA